MLNVAKSINDRVLVARTKYEDAVEGHRTWYVRHFSGPSGDGPEPLTEDASIEGLRLHDEEKAALADYLQAQRRG